MIDLKQKSQHPIIKALYQPMDIAGLAVIRILFGCIILLECWRYLDIMKIIATYTQSSFTFKYHFFEWVAPMSTQGMYYLFIAYALAGICIILGIFYHLSMIVAFLSISYLFLVDVTNYLNHFYLVIIFSCMMIFVPAYKGWSLYAYFKPNKASETVPAWCIWLIRIQLFIVYIYAAFAKMNVDWINGMPLYDWIGTKATKTGIESYLDLPIVIYAFTYCGLIYDLIVGPMLLFRKTRAFAYTLSLSFHLLNFYLFNIGIFPWFMLAATTIFFDTSWPRLFLNFFFEKRFLPVSLNYNPNFIPSFWQKSWIFVVAAHLTFQLGWPLRHFFYEGYVNWNEEGHDFSWHMKLRGKDGIVEFTVRDPKTGKLETIRSEEYLTKRQITKMPTRPLMILQFAHYLRDLYTYDDELPAEVYAETKVSVNGRKPQRIVDNRVNLSTITYDTDPSKWILPLVRPVWNAENKKNRFGPAFKKSEVAYRAIPGLDNELKQAEAAN